MKLTLILFFGTVFTLVAENSHSQTARVTIDKKSVTLQEVLSEIEEQTEYLFLYNKKNVDVSHTTSVQVSNQAVSTVLNTVLKDTDVSYEMVGNHIILSDRFDSSSNVNNATSINQQKKRTISGTVVDKTGEPLIGVSVLIKGTTQGGVTDMDGRLSLEVEDNNAVLQFSYLGYHSQDISTAGKSEINITLIEDTQLLDEVMVVGYGTQKKGVVTGSLSLTKGEDIVKSPSLNLGQSMQGRVSGVIMNVRSGEPGSDGASISIRGKSTTGNTDPLILIDGIANRGGNWDRISANDIESVTVLKDASAAIYGSRSANGVILITTKRGKEGKPTVNYSYNIGLQEPTRLPRMADAGTFAEVINEIEGYEGRNPRYTLAEVQKFKDGSDPIFYPNTKWFDETLNNLSVQQRHDLSIRGGNDRIKYFIGGGFSDQDGIYKKSNTYYKQYNVRSNIDAQITKNLKISVDLAGRIENQHYSGYDSGTIFYALTRSFPTTLARYPNGLPAAGMELGNPVTLVTDETGYRKYEKSVFNSTFSASLNLSWLTEGLSVDGCMAYDKEGMEKKEWRTPFHYYTWDEATDNYEKKKNGSRDFAELRQDYIPRSSLTLNARVNYKRTFDEVHGIDAIVGYEQSKHNGNDFWAWRSNYLSTAIDQLFAGSTNKQNLDVGGSAFEQARKSVFGRVAYDYAGKYMVQFNFRNDGSYIFAPGKRWGFFPGVSLGWRLSEENFIRDNLSWVNNLKLRGSYGQQGNDAVGASNTF